jgi:hypothetical protein
MIKNDYRWFSNTIQPMDIIDLPEVEINIVLVAMEQVLRDIPQRFDSTTETPTQEGVGGLWPT